MLLFEAEVTLIKLEVSVAGLFDKSQFTERGNNRLLAYVISG